MRLSPCLLICLLFVFFAPASFAQGAFAESEEQHVSSGLESANDKWPGGFHYGFSYIATADNQLIFDIDLIGGMESYDNLGGFLNKQRISVGFSPIRFELNFKTDQVVSDEFLFFVAPVGLLTVIAWGIHEKAAIPFGVLLELISGNNYWSLTDNDRFGVFDYHHVVSWFWSEELGYVENVGLRYVYKRDKWDSTSYIDLGTSLRFTNKDWAVGLFLRWGHTQIGK